MFKDFTRKFWTILLIGLILRIFLSASTYHPDIRTFQFSGQLISSGNIFNLYDYLGNFPSDHFFVRNFEINYPPLIYLLHGLSISIFSLIFGSAFFGNLVFLNAYEVNIVTNLVLLFLKLPYFIFDILAAVYISKLFDSEKAKFIAFIAWIFNPLTLYSTFMMGQFDIIPTFFIILSLFFLKLNQKNSAALALGLGIAFKVYPLFLLIVLALFGKTLWEKLKYLVLGLIPYLISIAPFIFSPGFRTNALLASQTDKSFYGKILISGGESIFLFPLFLLLLYIYFYYKKEDIQNIWRRYFIILLVFFTFTHFHPQWLLWITPFVIIDNIRNNFRFNLLYILLFIVFIGMLFFFDRSLTVGIFSPLFHSLSFQSSIWEILGINPDYFYSRSLLATAFAAGSLFLIFRLLREKLEFD